MAAFCDQCAVRGICRILPRVKGHDADVALAFPQFFKPEDVTAAATILKGYKPEVYAALAAGRGKA